MGTLIGPIPRNWWNVLKTTRESYMDERSKGRTEIAQQELGVFRTTVARFIQKDIPVTPAKAA